MSGRLYLVLASEWSVKGSKDVFTVLREESDEKAARTAAESYVKNGTHHRVYLAVINESVEVGVKWRNEEHAKGGGE